MDRFEGRSMLLSNIMYLEGVLTNDFDKGCKSLKRDKAPLQHSPTRSNDQLAGLCSTNGKEMRRHVSCDTIYARALSLSFDESWKWPKFCVICELRFRVCVCYPVSWACSNQWGQSEYCNTLKRSSCPHALLVSGSSLAHILKVKHITHMHVHRLHTRQQLYQRI